MTFLILYQKIIHLITIFKMAFYVLRTNAESKIIAYFTI